MDWNDIKIILEVARAGSFTAAAASLGTSKPTISRRIAEIEIQAGARLFRRGPHGAILTEAGGLVIQRAARVEETVSDFTLALRSLGHSPTPLISVRMSEGVASYLIAPVLAGQALGPLGVAAAREQISLPPIKILTSDSPQRSDISLVWTPHDRVPSAKESDKVRKLANVSFVPFFSDNYRRRGAGIQKFDDLIDHHLVTLRAYSWFQHAGWEHWHMLTSSAETAVTDWSCSVGHLTLTGIGIGLLPTYTPLYAQEMKPLDISTPAMVASVWMTCSEESARDPAVRRCLETLSRLFAAADWMLPR